MEVVLIQLGVLVMILFLHLASMERKSIDRQYTPETVVSYRYLLRCVIVFENTNFIDDASGLCGKFGWEIAYDSCLRWWFWKNVTASCMCMSCFGGYCTIPFSQYILGAHKYYWGEKLIGGKPRLYRFFTRRFHFESLWSSQNASFSMGCGVRI